MRFILIFILFSSRVFASEFYVLKEKIEGGSLREAVSYINYLKSAQVDIDFYRDIESMVVDCIDCKDQIRVGLLDLLLQANRNGLYDYSGDAEFGYFERVAKTGSPRVVYDVIFAVSKIEDLRSLKILKELGMDERYVRPVAMALSDMCHPLSAEAINDLIHSYQNDKSVSVFISDFRDKIRRGKGWAYRCVN